MTLTTIEVPFGLVKGTMYHDHLYKAIESMPWLKFLYENCERWDVHDKPLAALMDDNMVEVIYFFHLTPKVETLYRIKFS